jgi:hypothetical protein
VNSAIDVRVRPFASDVQGTLCGQQAKENWVTVEVNARFVGNVDLRELVHTFSPTCSVAGFGTDRNGSAVLRLIVEAQGAIDACRSVTATLLGFDALVVHDVRPGSYEEISDAEDAEERRFDEFMFRLGPDLQREVAERLAGLG